MSKLESFIHNCFSTNLDFLEKSQTTLLVLALTTHALLTISTSLHFPRVEVVIYTCHSTSRVDLQIFHTLFPKVAAISIACFEPSLVTQIEKLFQSCNHLIRFVLHAHYGIPEHQLCQLTKRNVIGEGSKGLIVTKRNGLKWQQFGTDDKQYAQIQWEHHMMEFFIEHK